VRRNSSSVCLFELLFGWNAIDLARGRLLILNGGKLINFDSKVYIPEIRMSKMEDFERWWSIAVYWIDSNFRALRSLSPDLLLAFGAICSFVTILVSGGWLYAIRRNNALKRQIRSLKDELAIVQQKYESEVTWRMAADRVFGKQPARSVQSSNQGK